MEIRTGFNLDPVWYFSEGISGLQAKGKPLCPTSSLWVVILRIPGLKG
jgi:hypothetical protein